MWIGATSINRIFRTIDGRDISSDYSVAILNDIGTYNPILLLTTFLADPGACGVMTFLYVEPVVFPADCASTDVSYVCEYPLNVWQ